MKRDQPDGQEETKFKAPPRCIESNTLYQELNRDIIPFYFTVYLLNLHLNVLYCVFGKLRFIGPKNNPLFHCHFLIHHYHSFVSIHFRLWLL